MLVPMLAKIAPLGSLQSQRKNVDLKDIQPGSPVEMTSSVGVPEQVQPLDLLGLSILLPIDYLGDDNVD